FRERNAVEKTLGSADLTNPVSASVCFSEDYSIQLTAVPLFASVKETALRLFVVPLVWLTQVFPASVVLMIIPFSPTAFPVSGSVNETASRPLLVPLVWLDHVLPPSVVLTIVPKAPTAVP